MYQVLAKPQLLVKKGYNLTLSTEHLLRTYSLRNQMPNGADVGI